MELLDSEVITLPTLPRTERSAAFLEALRKPITAEDLADLVQSVSELDGAFAVIETWCQRNPEKVFPKPAEEDPQSWEMLVEFLMKKAMLTVLHAAEEQGIEAFYEAVGRYAEALGAKILREIRVLALRNGVRGILNGLLQKFFN